MEEKKKFWFYAVFSLPTGPLSHYALAWDKEGLCLFQLPGATQKETQMALSQRYFPLFF